MYFTRGLAERLRVNQEIRDYLGEVVYPGDYQRYLDAVESHPFYDCDAAAWYDRVMDEWISSMREMRFDMCFNFKKLRGLYPSMFWGFGGGEVVTRAWARVTEMEKVSWIYSEIIKNPFQICSHFCDE